MEQVSPKPRYESVKFPFFDFIKMMRLARAVEFFVWVKSDSCVNITC